MHCGTCSKKFSLMRAKKQCCECRRYYCKYCVMRKANKYLHCENCEVLTARPLNKAQLLKLKARDLQLYLAHRQISTKGCIEKEDLVNLLIAHVNGQDFPSSHSANSSDEHFMGRHLLQNIRSFFSSTPDISQSRATSSVPSNPVNVPNSTHSTPNASFRPFQSTSNDLPSQPNTSTGEDWEIVNNPETNSNIENSPSLNINTREYTKSEPDVSKVCVHLKLSDIKSKDHLEQLNVKQLKDILFRNRVDYKGCVEKTELLDRVTRLWNEYNQSREDLEHLPMDDLCKICMDAPIECVMLECGHMATCTACGRQLSECPICRQYVVRVVRTFRS